MVATAMKTRPILRRMEYICLNGVYRVFTVDASAFHREQLSKFKAAAYNPRSVRLLKTCFTILADG